MKSERFLFKKISCLKSVKKFPIGPYSHEKRDALRPLFCFDGGPDLDAFWCKTTTHQNGATVAHDIPLRKHMYFFDTVNWSSRKIKENYYYVRIHPNILVFFSHPCPTKNFFWTCGPYVGQCGFLPPLQFGVKCKCPREWELIMELQIP